VYAPKPNLQEMVPRVPGFHFISSSCNFRHAPNRPVYSIQHTSLKICGKHAFTAIFHRRSGNLSWDSTHGRDDFQHNFSAATFL
jgi:hypothetical protein